MCNQQSLRSACAYAQSDQSLCLSPEYSMTFRLLIEHHLEFLSLKGGCTGSCESTFVEIPHFWKSRHGSNSVIQKQECFWEILLGDNCIQNIHLGRYIVGYTVGNLVLRRRVISERISLKAPITTAADNNLCDIFPNFLKK